MNRESAMGGLNETWVGGVRIHENNGEVHLHDDKAGLKVAVPKDTFKFAYATLQDKLIGNPSAEHEIEDKARGTSAKLRGLKDSQGRQDITVTIAKKPPASGVDKTALDLFVASL